MPLMCKKKNAIKYWKDAVLDVQKSQCVIITIIITIVNASSYKGLLSSLTDRRFVILDPVAVHSILYIAGMVHRELALRKGRKTSFEG